MIVQVHNTKSKVSGRPKADAEKRSRRTYSLESIMALQKALEMGMVDASFESVDSPADKEASGAEEVRDWRGALRRAMAARNRALHRLRRRLAFFLLGKDKSRPTYGGLR